MGNGWPQATSVGVCGACGVSCILGNWLCKKHPCGELTTGRTVSLEQTLFSLSSPWHTSFIICLHIGHNVNVTYTCSLYIDLRMEALAFVHLRRSITEYYAKPINYTSVGVSVGREAQSPIERQPVIASPQSYIVHTSSLRLYLSQWVPRTLLPEQRCTQPRTCLHHVAHMQELVHEAYIHVYYVLHICSL